METWQSATPRQSASGAFGNKTHRTGMFQDIWSAFRCLEMASDNIDIGLKRFMLYFLTWC